MIVFEFLCEFFMDVVVHGMFEGIAALFRWLSGDSDSPDPVDK